MSQSSPSRPKAPSMVICAGTENSGPGSKGPASASAGCVTSGKSPDLSEWGETLPARLLARMGDIPCLNRPPTHVRTARIPPPPTLSPSYRLKAAVSAGRLKVLQPQSASRSPQRGILLLWPTLRLGAQLALGSPEAPSPFIHAHSGWLRFCSALIYYCGADGGAAGNKSLNGTELSG